MPASARRRTSQIRFPPYTSPKMKGMKFMKNICCLLGAGLGFLLAGCATPVALTPVGPNPYGGANSTSEGELVVFSRLHGCTEGNNPTWYQHSDYNIYDLQGKLVKHVGNSIGRYEQAPLGVALPPGQYIVRSRAAGYLRIDVPVIIERGRTTRVHLDGDWKYPAGTEMRELVSLPNGSPVGWRAEFAKGG
jgi:hypothetical protein